MISKLLLKFPQLRAFKPIVDMEVGRHMSPSFFIVGFQKCGTTTLYDSIMQHPNAKIGLMKENNILAEKRERIDEFKMCFPYKESGMITGDASHLHTWMPYGLQRIKTHFPASKIIVIMRNPVDRAYSHFNMDQKFGYLPKSMSFDQLIEIEMKVRETLSDGYDHQEVYDKLNLYGNRYGWPLSRGLYHIYIERLIDLELEYLPLFLEDLQDDYEGVMTSVFKFIGLDDFKLAPRQSNKGNYQSTLDDSVRHKLERFYEEPNNKLETLIRKSTPW